MLLDIANIIDMGSLRSMDSLPVKSETWDLFSSVYNNHNGDDVDNETNHQESQG